MYLRPPPRLYRTLGVLAVFVLLCCLLLPAPHALARTRPQETPVDTLEDAASAVVRIEAVGTFVDPSDGTQQNVPGFGTGFLIDPSGIVVTNNHVVTGGTLFRVHVPGRAQPVNARIMGVSECSDLAVIDLQGEGYPYLEWADLQVRQGQQVHAAGYPRGGPEMVLTEGKVTTVNASGQSNWSSLDRVVAHDARIRPGNSGGPLLDSDGRVVGVNYARVTSPRQSFAIPAETAFEIVEVLRTGQDVDSLGINGVALAEEERTGVWVSSVASGSPADRAGVLPGDLLFELEEVLLGTNGTMADYCDILRSHTLDDLLRFKLYRSEEAAVYAGQFNGQALAISRSDQYPPARTELTFAYRSVQDANGILSFDVRSDWTETEELEWVYEDEVVGRRIVISPDIEKFLNDWSIPGMIVGWSFSLGERTTPRSLSLAPDLPESCANAETAEYGEDGAYEAFRRLYVGCEDDAFVLVESFADLIGDYVITIEFYTTSLDDLEAYERFHDSLDVNVAIAEIVNADGYIRVVDDSERISLQVPRNWDDSASEALVEDGREYGRLFRVSPDVREYNQYWGTPGMTIILFNDVSLEYDDLTGWLDALEEMKECDYEGRYDWEGGNFQGVYDFWIACGGNEESFLANYALLPRGLVQESGAEESGAEGGAARWMVVVLAALPSAAHLAALEPMLRSLEVSDGNGSLPSVSKTDGVTATILADALNIRRGPGMQYEILGQMARGQVSEVVGQYGSCAWLFVPLEDGETGWISGKPEYTSLSSECSEIPARDAP